VSEYRDGADARYRTIIFWVYEPIESLRPRLGKRVDKMVENGLLKEIAELRKIAKEVYGREDHTEGIFQSIGKSHIWFSRKADGRVQRVLWTGFGPR
jgi:tRNA A37 N6-isopentenylltransferase MiaA